MLSTVGCRQSQFADESDDLDGDIRAIWPVTDVFRQRLFATVNDRAERYDRHYVRLSSFRMISHAASRLQPLQEDNAFAFASV